MVGVRVVLGAQLLSRLSAGLRKINVRQRQLVHFDEQLVERQLLARLLNQSDEIHGIITFECSRDKIRRADLQRLSNDDKSRTK